MVVKFMMGASIRCKIPMNIQAAESRVRNMQVLQWAKDAESVLTEEESRKLNHVLGNCSESVPWQAMYENPQPLENRALLYTHTFALPKKNQVNQVLEVKFPCLLCRHVAVMMFHHRVAIMILS